MKEKTFTSLLSLSPSGKRKGNKLAYYSSPNNLVYRSNQFYDIENCSKGNQFLKKNVLSLFCYILSMHHLSFNFYYTIQYVSFCMYQTKAIVQSYLGTKYSFLQNMQDLCSSHFPEEAII